MIVPFEYDVVGLNTAFSRWRARIDGAECVALGLSTHYVPSEALEALKAELIAAPSGLGFMIQNAGQYFRTDITIVGIIVIGLLGALLDQIANRAGRALTSWSEVRRDP